MAASALYACTKCTQRYPFEELSQGQQLCKVAHEGAGPDKVQGSRVGLSEAAACLCRRDPGVEMFSSRFSAWFVLSFHREAGDGMSDCSSYCKMYILQIRISTGE
ncbi:hypothetical protein MC885_020093, partial [Smutsia gigantea]